MSTMIAQALATDGSWTLIAAGPIANILIAGPSAGYEIYIGSSLPANGTSGMPLTSLDGSWSASVLAAGDNVYARPFGAFNGRTMSISGIKN